MYRRQFVAAAGCEHFRRATGDDGLRYRGSFERTADIEAATDIDVPAQR